MLMKLMKDAKSIGQPNIHNVPCSICTHVIDQIDRYHCLECSTNIDLCSNCFEKRRQTDQHTGGHALIHMKLPNEFFGISVKSFRVMVIVIKKRFKVYDLNVIHVQIIGEVRSACQ